MKSNHQIFKMPRNAVSPYHVKIIDESPVKVVHQEPVVLSKGINADKTYVIVERMHDNANPAYTKKVIVEPTEKIQYQSYNVEKGQISNAKQTTNSETFYKRRCCNSVKKEEIKKIRSFSKFLFLVF